MKQRYSIDFQSIAILESCFLMVAWQPISDDIDEMNLMHFQMVLDMAEMVIQWKKLSQCTCYFYSVSVLMTSSFFNGSWFVSSLRTSRKAKVKAKFDDKKVRRVRQKINAIMRHIDGIIIFHKRHVTTPLINGNMVKNEQKWTTCRLFGRTTFFEKDCFTSSFCSKIKIKGRK